MHTLRRNRSLTDFSLVTPEFDDESSVIPNLLRAAVLQTKVKSLKLGQSGELRVMSRNILADVACRHDCLLRTLCILSDPYEKPGSNISQKNSSVEVLEIKGVVLDGAEAYSTR